MLILNARHRYHSYPGESARSAGSRVMAVESEIHTSMRRSFADSRMMLLVSVGMAGDRYGIMYHIDQPLKMAPRSDAVCDCTPTNADP
jgi:hypothetical protein